jgi:hypothetical protein
MSAEDAELFAPVLAAWRPAAGTPTVLLRWLVSEWCNYRCPYCTQTHDRHAPKGGRFTAHAFDNFPLDTWLAAFDRHFAGRGLSMVITGGEPFADRKAMPVLLNHLSAMPGTACIRVDTNAWWKAGSFRDVDRSKLILMCTLHPSQTQPDAFFARIDDLLREGFRIGMVNYVMDAQNIVQYRQHKAVLNAKGIPLHPNPLWRAGNRYSPEDLELLHEELSAADFAFRTGKRSPKGMKCLYPALAYEMTYTGRIHVGCHPAAGGSFFDDELPRAFAGPVPCPHESCSCLDMYSFLAEVNRNTGLNPLEVYGRQLRAAQGIDAVREDAPAG